MIMPRRGGRCLPLLCSLVLVTAFTRTAFPDARPAGVLSGQVLGQLGEIDAQCWDTSSMALIQMKRLHVLTTVVSLWDFMVHLKLSQHQRHNDLFLDLVQHF